MKTINSLERSFVLSVGSKIFRPKGWLGALALRLARPIEAKSQEVLEAYLAR